MISGLPVEVIAKDVGTVFTGRDIVRIGRQTPLFTGFVMLDIASFRENWMHPAAHGVVGLRPARRGDGDIHHLLHDRADLGLADRDRRPRLVIWLIDLRVAPCVMGRGHIVRHRHAPIDPRSDGSRQPRCRVVSVAGPGLSAPLGEGRWPMDQNVVTTAPTTSAWAAIASMELVTVSNIRMGWSPMPERYPASAI
jgi:hypothetical protein